MEISGKTIAITGASSGIGKSLALMLAKKGAKVALLARRKERLEQIKSEIETFSPNVLAMPCDVRNRDNVDACIAQIAGKFGSIDGIINNAGKGYFGTVANMQANHIFELFEINILGPINLIQSVLPHLKKSKGIIVNISSSLSKRSLPFLSYYAGTKSMLDAISDGLRLELRKHGISVVNYCPPETETEFHASSINGDGLEMFSSKRKFMKADDVALEIICAIKKEKREVVKGKFLKTMNFYFPRLLDKIFYKHMVLKLQSK